MSKGVAAPQSGSCGPCRTCSSRLRGRLFHGVVEGEDLVRARDPEDLEHLVLGADQSQRAVEGAGTTLAADQRTKAGGLDEVHLQEVHHEVDVTGHQRLEDRVLELGTGREVDLALRLKDREVATAKGVDLQMHGLTSGP